jgi:hypothetical protein
MKKDVFEFIEHAEDILNKIETNKDLKISKEDLEFVKKKIKYMINSLKEESPTLKNYPYPELTRLIIDQWPLGDKLGSEISDLEEKYIKLYKNRK